MIIDFIPLICIGIQLTFLIPMYQFVLNPSIGRQNHQHNIPLMICFLNYCSFFYYGWVVDEILLISSNSVGIIATFLSLSFFSAFQLLYQTCFVYSMFCLFLIIISCLFPHQRIVRLPKMKRLYFLISFISWINAVLWSFFIWNYYSEENWLVISYFTGLSLSSMQVTLYSKMIMRICLRGRSTTFWLEV